MENEARYVISVGRYPSQSEILRTANQDLEVWAAPADTPVLLRASEVACILNVSSSTAYRLIRSGDIPAVRVGHCVRVRYPDLITYIDGSRLNKPAKT